MLKKRLDLKITSLDTHEYYETEEGKIIAFLPSTPKYIQVFESEAAFLAIVAKVNQSDYTKHPLESYGPQLADMPTAIMHAHQSLQGLLGLTGWQLDYTFESLRLIDHALNKLKVTVQVFLKDFYFPLMLYVGETVCRQRGAHWKTQDTLYAKETFLVLSDGITINAFMPLYAEATEHYDTLSVYDTVDLMLFNEPLS